jgi:hypothetical protein
VGGNRARLLPDSNAAIESLVADIDAAKEHVRISADSPGSVTTRAIVTAPIIVAAATRARRRASAVPAFPARMSTSLTKPTVAAARAFLSDRASSPPSAASRPGF